MSAGLGDRPSEREQQSRPARARLREDQYPLAEGERTEQVDRADQRLGSGVGREQPPVRRRRREILEMAALVLGALAVDGLDPDERAVALAPPRLPGRARDLVTRPKLAPTDL